MFVDAFTQLCAAQAVTADAVSENTLDLGNVTPKRQIGTGEPMGVQVTLTAVGTNTGSADIQIIGSATADLGTPTVYTLLRLVAAQLVAGKTYIVNVPPGTPGLRYFGLNFDITGTVDFTVDAHLAPLSMLSIQTPLAYADAISIR